MLIVFVAYPSLPADFLFCSCFSLAGSPTNNRCPAGLFGGCPTLRVLQEKGRCQLIDQVCCPLGPGAANKARVSAMGQKDQTYSRPNLIRPWGGMSIHEGIVPAVEE